MIKIFELLVRKPGQTAEAFLDALTAAAGQLGDAPGVKGYDVQVALGLPARTDIVQLDVPSAVDAFVEVWADTVEDYQAAMASPAGAAWRKARAALVAEAKTLVLQEKPKIPVPQDRPPRRNNAFLTRHARFTPEEFRYEWHIGHGDMCLVVPYLKGFVPCDVIDVLPQTDVPELQTDQIEGIAQAYFDTLEEEMAMIKTPEAKAWFAHGAQTFGLIKAFGAIETVSAPPRDPA
jgi:quinol monooxygenase YgiN